MFLARWGRMRCMAGHAARAAWPLHTRAALPSPLRPPPVEPASYPPLPPVVTCLATAQRICRIQPSSMQNKPKRPLPAHCPRPGPAHGPPPSPQAPWA